MISNTELERIIEDAKIGLCKDQKILIELRKAQNEQRDRLKYERLNKEILKEAETLKNLRQFKE